MKSGSQTFSLGAAEEGHLEGMRFAWQLFLRVGAGVQLSGGAPT